MAILEVEDLHAGYGDFLVLKGVDLVAHEGQIVCIIGPNGAGKSTLFRCIFNLITPEQGDVRFKGESIVGLAQRDLIDRGISYILQRSAAFPDMTVRENLRMGIYTANREYDFETRAEEMYELFPLLEERKHQKAGKLSGGQQQMLELARGLMLDPDLLLVDEPSAGLAPKVITSVFERIEDINDLGVTIVIIEQNVKTGLAHADHGYVLEGGRTRFNGPADTLLDQPEVREAYLQTAGD